MRLPLSRPLTINPSEVLRYLKSREDQSLSGDLTAACDKILALVSPATAAVMLPLIHEDEKLLCGGLELSGTAIKHHLRNCDQCILLAVTLGFAVDRLISAAGQSDPYRALLFDACATAAVEDLADHATERARELLVTESHSGVTSRFSPGYGDLPLSLQPKLLEVLDARRLLGLTVGSSLLLSPIKSVTAIIGVTDDNHLNISAAPLGCSKCSMSGNCAYSKSTTKG